MAGWWSKRWVALTLLALVSVTLQANTEAFSAVGWLRAGNKQCTATLVSSRQVVTAAHCLYDNKRRKLYHPSHIEFFADYSDGDYRLSSLARSYTAGLKTFPKGSFDETLVYNDWAVVTLSTPIGCSIEPIEIDHTSVTNSELSTAGYGVSAKGILVEQHGCQYALPPRKETGIRLKNCEIESGFSGGPLLRKSKGQWLIVGVISAEAEDSKGRLRQVAVPNIAFRSHIKQAACRR
ncbi:trypsin-like serine protease [Vibrio sp. FNV 38]|nr:trypsin-like serine protease [Vibrio sp. FNV 38]